MGIPAHDNVAFVYTGEVITSATYSLNDVVVATVIYTYNAGGDVTNIERTG